MDNLPNVETSEPARGRSILCLASYFKGNQFLEQCKREGCHVVLLTLEPILNKPWVRESIVEVLESRAKFEAFLRRIGRAPLPSTANFVLVPVAAATEKGLALREHGVAVRPFPGLHGVGDALRISVGPWALMEQTLDAFEAVLA